MATYTPHLDHADLVDDVHGPLPTGDGRPPPLLLIGQPMDARYCSALVAELAACSATMAA